jgi:hypothetical protein
MASTRAQALAERFEQTSEEFAALVEGCSDADWRSVCKGEGWSVGVTAHHVAGGFGRQRGWLASAANGEALKRPAGGPDPINAQHAQEFADVTREETLEVARRDAVALTAAIRALTDEQLDRSVQFRRDGPPWSVAELVQRVFVGHIQMHATSIHEAIGR